MHPLWHSSYPGQTNPPSPPSLDPPLISHKSNAYFSCCGWKHRRPGITIVFLQSQEDSLSCFFPSLFGLLLFLFCLWTSPYGAVRALGALSFFWIHTSGSSYWPFSRAFTLKLQSKNPLSQPSTNTSWSLITSVFCFGMERTAKKNTRLQSSSHFVRDILCETFCVFSSSAPLNVIGIVCSVCVCAQVQLSVCACAYVHNCAYVCVMNGTKAPSTHHA